MPTPAVLDTLLTLQLAVAWAGESGREQPRLRWWKTSDLHTEDGGLDLLGRLLPHTGRWAALQTVREAARRTDALLRARAHDPDRLVTLFRLGFALDEQLEERLDHHKRAGLPPLRALPGLAEVVTERWDRGAFEAWVKAHGPVAVVSAPAGRQLAEPSAAPERLAAALVGALDPLPAEYPLPHARRP